MANLTEGVQDFSLAMKMAVSALAHSRVPALIETHIFQSIEKFRRMLDEETVQATRRAIAA